MKNFIVRTQAKVDAKLTQRRLLSTLSPAKRENDPFHPSLDLSPSCEEGTSSNVISDNEQPEDVAKELFPPAETTAHTAKGKGAQEPQHQVQAPAPPTNSEKVQDSVPEGTHENTEGSHPCDAEELKQQEESRADQCGDSAMNKNAVLNDDARRTNEVEPDNSLLTPREEHTKRPKTGKTLLPMKRMVIPETPSSTLPLPRMVSLQNSWLNIKVRSTHTIIKHYGEKSMPMTP